VNGPRLPWWHHCRQVYLSATALSVLVLVGTLLTSSAQAGTDHIINNTWVQTDGLFGPRHSLTRVYVHGLNGNNTSCEDAWEGGNWAQEYHYCIYRGATWHDFCGCQLRQGWNGSSYPGPEQMNGHQNWGSEPVESGAAPKPATTPLSSSQSFGVLRQLVAARPPTAVTSAAWDPVIADTYAPNAQLTRVTHPRGDESDAWYVTPGTESICFYAQKEQQGACTTLTEATTHGLLVWGVPAGVDAARGAQVVFGLVPDDVVSAAATGASGEQPAQIDDNVLRVTGNGITSLTLKTTTDSRQVNLTR
jgi:hypothetical protein